MTRPIIFSEETFHKLCNEYLSYVEDGEKETKILGMLQLFGYVPAHVEIFVKLMLLDPDDRPLLGEFCVYVHYMETHKNFLIRTGEETCGEDSECAARRLNERIRQRADAFAEYCDKINREAKKKGNKKINKLNNQAAVLRKEIKKTEQEIKEMLDQVDKKKRQTDKKRTQLKDIENKIEELRSASN